MARLLAPEDFGLIAMAMVVTGFIGLFTELGLSTVTIQRKEVDQNLVSALFLISLAVGFAIMLTAWATAPVVGLIFDDPRVPLLVIALSVTILAAAGSAQHKALLSRRMRWRALRTNVLASQLVALVAAISLAILTDIGYWALVAAAWAQALTGLILAWIVADWRPSRVTDWRVARSAVGFGANLTLFTFANWFNRNLDNALIGWRWGPDELGYYTRAYQLLVLPINLVSSPVASAAIPALSRMQDEPERWRTRVLEVMGAALFLSSALTSVLIATSDAVVRVTYGEGWQTTADIFFILVFAIFSSSVLNAMGWVYISLGRAKRMARWGLMALPMYVSGFVIGVPYGAIGVATAFVVVANLLLVPGVIFATHDTPLRPFVVFRIAAGPILIGLLAGSVGRYAGEPSASASTTQAIEAIVIGAGAAGCAFLIGSVLVLMLDDTHFSLRHRLTNWLKSGIARAGKRGPHMRRAQAVNPAISARSKER